jgi:stringent starvation protein B
MTEVSTTPYLIRAIHEWCTESGFTPYIAVLVGEGVRVPVEFVKDGEIVLNISPLATSRLRLGNEAIEFQARFGGVAREVYVPVGNVLAVYARENGQGMAFEVPRGAAGPSDVSVGDSPKAAQPALSLLQSPAPTAPVALVARPAAEDSKPIEGEPDDTPPAPRPGERPRLTRIK